MTISISDGAKSNAGVSVMYPIEIAHLHESSVKGHASVDVSKAISKSAGIREDISIMRAAGVPKEDILPVEVRYHLVDVLGCNIIRLPCF